MKDYNINELFDIAFGIKTTETFSGSTRLSSVGTNMIVPVIFKGKRYQVYNESGLIVKQAFEDFELPATTLVNFRRAKNITKTKASGSTGTVKELFGFDDWQINIRGFCLADLSHQTAKTAQEQKIRLNEFDAIIDSIQVVSELFDDLNVSHLVIEEVKFNQLKGKPGIVPFHLKCISDEPSELLQPWF